MQQFLIQGGKPLHGELAVSGAKNAVLPLLAAALLATTPIQIKNVPDLHDVTTLIDVLKSLGVTVTQQDGCVTVDNSTLNSLLAPYELVKTMRASILVLGPLLARYGEAKVSLPGGCAIGSRPVDLHLKALEALGADINVENGYVHATSKTGLKGNKIVFDIVTVGGTEHLLTTACLAQGTTIIENAAREPEVIDLANMLVKMGAQIEGIGSDRLTIHGVNSLSGCEHHVVADRIEAGSYLAAAIMTRGSIKLTQLDTHLMDAVLVKIDEMGAHISTGERWLSVDMKGNRPRAVGFRTLPHPGFPTDMQAQLMAVNTIAEGTATVIETIFENRFMHVPELVRMGAKIQVDGHTAIITGVEQLQGAQVMATDLRASFSLVIAALSAVGTTVVDRIYHIDRGYEHVTEKLQSLGADISRIRT